MAVAGFEYWVCRHKDAVWVPDLTAGMSLAVVLVQLTIRKGLLGISNFYVSVLPRSGLSPGGTVLSGWFVGQIQKKPSILPCPDFCCYS